MSIDIANHLHRRVRSVVRLAATLECTVAEGVDWLVRAVSRTGVLNDQCGLTAYYKLPLALALAAQHEDGRRILGLATQKFRTTEGHFVDRDPGRRLRYCDLYEDLWLSWGALALGESSSARRTFSYVERFFDRRSGGLSSTVDTPPGKRLFDLRSTALGGLVALELGDADIAQRAAQFTAHLLLDQPLDPTGFYLVRDADGAIVREFAKDRERFFIVRRDQHRPLFYALGLAVCLLARYGLVTGDLSFLPTARQYVDASLAISMTALSHDYSGKLFWGLCLLDQLTGDGSYAELSARVGRYLCERQSAEGAWVPSDEQGLQMARSLDLTAEYCVWLQLVARRDPDAEGLSR